jgi:hypothetical protein
LDLHWKQAQKASDFRDGEISNFSSEKVKKKLIRIIAILTSKRDYPVEFVRNEAT